LPGDSGITIHRLPANLEGKGAYITAPYQGYRYNWKNTMLISTKHNCASVFVLHLNMSTLWMMRLCFALLFLKGTEAAQVNLSSTATAVGKSLKHVVVRTS